MLIVKTNLAQAIAHMTQCGYSPVTINSNTIRIYETVNKRQIDACKVLYNVNVESVPVKDKRDQK